MRTSSCSTISTEQGCLRFGGGTFVCRPPFNHRARARGISPEISRLFLSSLRVRERIIDASHHLRIDRECAIDYYALQLTEERETLMLNINLKKTRRMWQGEKFTFDMVASNGEPVVPPERYKTKAGPENAVDTIIRDIQSGNYQINDLT
jgi:uncharacterized protein YegP (UPF0339 family)